ncbi:MAG: hypothetical protein FWE75_08270 [Actinomycetia bacterium]|nr:hypothetical protein [Actinomycetes bacterium]
MGDLYVDGPMLDRVHGHLSHMRDLLETPAKKMASVDGAAMGADELARRMDDFGHEWHYGIGKLGEFSHGAVTALEKIKSTFEKADTDLAKALTDAAKNKGDAK